LLEWVRGTNGQVKSLKDSCLKDFNHLKIQLKI
jgi:hypothetical protein